MDDYPQGTNAVVAVISYTVSEILRMMLLFDVAGIAVACFGFNFDCPHVERDLTVGGSLVGFR